MTRRSLFFPATSTGAATIGLKPSEISRTAVALDPRNPNAYNLLADTYNLQRRHLLAAQVYDRVLAAGERTPIVSVSGRPPPFSMEQETQQRCATCWLKTRTWMSAADKLLYRVFLALIDGNFAEAERVLAASPREDFQDIDYSFYYPKSLV